MENHHLAEIRPFGDDFPDTDPSSNVSTFLVIVFHPGSGLCFFGQVVPATSQSRN